VLILSENWYPGWLAWVDDVPAAVLPVASLLRGVSLVAGEQRVVLAYRPLTVHIGMAISAIATTGLLVLFALAGAQHIIGRGVV